MLQQSTISVKWKYWTYVTVWLQEYYYARKSKKLASFTGSVRSDTSSEGAEGRFKYVLLEKQSLNLIVNLCPLNYRNSFCNLKIMTFFKISLMNTILCDVWRNKSSDITFCSPNMVYVIRSVPYNTCAFEIKRG